MNDSISVDVSGSFIVVVNSWKVVTGSVVVASGAEKIVIGSVDFSKSSVVAEDSVAGCAGAASGCAGAASGGARCCSSNFSSAPLVVLVTISRSDIPWSTSAWILFTSLSPKIEFTSDDADLALGT